MLEWRDEVWWSYPKLFSPQTCARNQPSVIWEFVAEKRVIFNIDTLDMWVLSKIAEIFSHQFGTWTSRPNLFGGGLPPIGLGISKSVCASASTKPAPRPQLAPSVPLGGNFKKTYFVQTPKITLKMCYPQKNDGKWFRLEAHVSSNTCRLQSHHLQGPCQLENWGYTLCNPPYIQVTGVKRRDRGPFCMKVLFNWGQWSNDTFGSSSMCPGGAFCRWVDGEWLN